MRSAGPLQRHGTHRCTSSWPHLKLAQLVHLSKVREHAGGFLSIDDADGEAHMHDHIVAECRFWHVGKVHRFDDPAEAHPAGSCQWVIAYHAHDFSWDGQAHGRAPSSSVVSCQYG